MFCARLIAHEIGQLAVAFNWPFGQLKVAFRCFDLVVSISLWMVELLFIFNMILFFLRVSVLNICCAVIISLINIVYLV